MSNRRLPRRALDGVLLLDKAGGATSNAALQAVRRLFNAAKAGHTGTLDPLACGLLPVCFGEATKFAGDLLGADKEYEATVQLGVTTDSGDAEGRVIARAPVAVRRDQVLAAMDSLRGEQMQVPPMYSALKRDGRPLYELARAGIEVERAPRRIFVASLELLELGDDWLSFRVACSKGTYVRTLAEDIGGQLGCGGHLTALRRTRLGRLRLADAVTYERLAALDEADRDALLLPVDALLSELPQMSLGEAEAAAFCHGQGLRVENDVPGRIRVYSANRFLGVGEADGAGGLRPKRLLAG